MLRSMLHAWLALPLLAFALQSPGDVVTTPAGVPQAVNEAIPSLADQLTFGVNGPRMTVPVQIASAGPFDFIIDTGAQRTVISRALANELKLARGRDVHVMAMTGGSSVSTVVIPDIRVSTIGGERIEAPALDGTNLGAPGMLGIDTLQGHAVAIDFDRQTMALTPSSRKTRTERHDPDEIVIRARSLLGQLVVTDAYVKGDRVRVIIDTGSVVSMGNEALRRKVMRRKQPDAPIQLISVTGGTLQADYTALDTIKIGDLSINALPIAFADAPPFATFGLKDKPAILLGMDALRLFRRVHIDFANREVRLLMPREARRG
ncbi:Retroviral aspartyl protease [Sphingomonas sp. EC-HK361]|nr:Retroviral aspartyl protease [Sphingomonas sp. EC-HK361]